MATLNYFLVDAVAQTGLIIINDTFGAEITRYSYGASGVTLAERPTQSVVLRADMVSNIGDIHAWASHVKSQIAPPSPARPDTRADFRRDDNSVRGLFHFNGVLMTDVKWRDATDEATFEPRIETVLTWAEFAAWLRFLQDFANQARAWTGLL